MNIDPIGVVRSERTTVTDDGWGAVRATIELDPATVQPDALDGLDEFSHIEVVFRFHLCDESDVVRGARHPRGNLELPCVGVLAQRVKDRPNHLGVSRCRLLAVDGLSLSVVGLDAVDGSPVLDVKPYLSSMVPDPPSVREPAWVSVVMKRYQSETE